MAGLTGNLAAEGPVSGPLRDGHQRSNTFPGVTDMTAVSVVMGV